MSSALRRAACAALAQPRTASWTLLALTCALAAAGIAVLAASNIEGWTSTRRGGASMVVYLGERVDEARGQSLAGELAKLPGVERAELVPPAETARRLEAALGMPNANASRSLLEGIEVASLPASVEVTLAPGVRDVIAMSPTVRALRGTPGVEDVVVEDGGSDRVAGTLSVVRVVAWTGAALLGGLALVIVLAAIRIRLARGARERRVLHLLGASPAFTFVPTALAGALQGAVAALLATAVICTALAAWGDAIAGALHGALGAVAIAAPAGVDFVLFVALGAALGLVGGGLAGASRA